MTLPVLSPVSGDTVRIEDVPDPVFSGKMVGPGIAVAPVGKAEITALAPISGKIVKLFPHAFVVQDTLGHAVLVHLGLDTVQLDDAKFSVAVNAGAQVQAGDPITHWNPAWVTSQGCNPLVIVVALEAQETDLQLVSTASVCAGAPLFNWS